MLVSMVPFPYLIAESVQRVQQTVVGFEPTRGTMLSYDNHMTVSYRHMTIT